MVNPILDMVLAAQETMCEETCKACGRLLALPAVAEHAARVRVATTPRDVVYEEDGVRLLRYRNEGGVAVREPLLFCYALVNRPSILDLRPERSVVRQFLERGFDVYLIDWGVPTAADRTLRLKDYVCRRLKRIVRAVRRRSGSPTVNLVGYCMGGTLAALFAARYPERVNTLTLLAAPIDFAAGDGLLHVWSREAYFDVDRFIDAHGNCPAPFLRAVFQLARPVHNFVEKYAVLAEHLHDEKYLEDFFALEKWGQESIPVAGETYREFVKCLYQGNELVRGKLRLGGRKVKLKRITCPLLLLTADLDHLVPPAATLGIRAHVRSRDVGAMAVDAGHVGLAVSSKAHRRLWPEAAAWVKARSTVCPAP